MKLLQILLIGLLPFIYVACAKKEVTPEIIVKNNCKYEKITAKIIVKLKHGEKLSYLIIDKKYSSDNKEQRYVLGIIPDLKDKEPQTQHTVSLDLLISGKCEILDTSSIKLVSSY